MADKEYLHECTCTEPAHGGKLWLCDTEACKRDFDQCADHPDTCRCEVCRFWS
jgi:hypothetical protein